MVGGRCLSVPSLADVNRELAALPQFSEAKVRYSAVAGTGQPTLEADAVTEEVRFVSGVKRVVKLFEYLSE